MILKTFYMLLDFILLKFNNIVFSRRLKYQIIHYLYFTNIIKLQINKMQIGRYKYEFDFFSWIKKTELVELDGVNPSDDPVRPELDNGFRTSKGRKIFGLKYKDDIEGIACFAFTNEIPATIKEMDLMSVEEDQATIPIAYTLWSFKKGAGKKIMKELQKYIKSKEQFESIITISPLTPVATHYHIRNGARLIKINPTTQNFEYKI